MYDYSRIEKKYKSLDAQGKMELFRKLKAREIVRGLKFSVSRSLKDGKGHSITRHELGYVRTQMRLENLI